MLSNQSKYAIRAVLYLAIHSDRKNKLSAKIIAEKIDIPAPFLAKTFQTLAKAKLIHSVKGPNGGFYLTDEDKNKNLFEIIECIDGLRKFKECFIGLPRCSDDNPCAIHHIVKPFRESLIKELTTNTIEDFAKETQKGKSFIFLK